MDRLIAGLTWSKCQRPRPDVEGPRGPRFVTPCVASSGSLNFHDSLFDKLCGPLTARDRAIERLEQSVQAYQDDRERLAVAYEQLRVSLGQPLAENRLGAEPEPSSRGTMRRASDKLSVSEDPRQNGVARRDD